MNEVVFVVGVLIVLLAVVGAVADNRRRTAYREYRQRCPRQDNTDLNELLRACNRTLDTSNTDAKSDTV